MNSSNAVSHLCWLARHGLINVLVFVTLSCSVATTEAQPSSNMYDGYSSVTVPFSIPFGWGSAGVGGNPPAVNMQLGDYPEGGNPNPIHPFSIDTGSVGITVSTSLPNAKLVGGQYFKPGANDILVYPAVSTHYSSSNITESGAAYLTTVGLFDPNNTLMATARVLVMAVTQESCTDGTQNCSGALQTSCAGVSPCSYPKFISYSGVGFRAGMAFAQSPTDKLNPFTSLTSLAGMPNAQIRQGYIISKTGVTLGLSSAATNNFAFIKLGNYTVAPQPNNVNWAYPLGNLTINNVTGQAQILVDTGIGQMYLTPAPGVVYAKGSGANALPAGSKIQIAIPGMENAFGMSYEFIAGSLDNPLAPLSYVVTSKNGTVENAFVNTGRDVIQGYNYLYDADGGYVGFSWNGSISTQFGQFAPTLTLLGTVPLPNGFATNLPTMLLQDTSVSTTGSAFLAGDVSGPGMLTLTGGLLRMSGNNTYSGGTLIAGGTLSISRDTNLGASAGQLIFSGGLLQTVSNMTSARGVVMNTTANIQPASGTTLTLSGSIMGTGGLKMSGEGTLTLSGINTYTGGTEVANGTLAVNNDSNLGAVTGAVLLSGGSLQTTGNMRSARSFALSNVAFFEPATNTSLAISGVLSGSGGIFMMGNGTMSLTGANTFSGGTGVFSGTLAITGDSPLGTGPVYVGSGATLIGTGMIAGTLSVGGTLKPGNSPGYLSTQSTVNMLSGGTYQQDIAGKTQASASTLAGSAGYYSFLNVMGGAFTIEPGATLAPRLQNLFNVYEPGYGSAPYVPVLGDKFSIMTADGGILGKFSLLAQPAGLAPGTQFAQFYNLTGNNNLELGVIPSSYATTLASSNANTRSVARALDQMSARNVSGSSTTTQDQLLYAGMRQSGGLSSYARNLAGELYGATIAIVPQTTQRMQQSVLSHLDSTTTMPAMGHSAMAPAGTAISATNPGGQPTSSMHSNPSVNPQSGLTPGASLNNGALWGEVAFQYGNRPGDSNASGWASNLYQAVLGVDAYAEAGTKLGGGISLSNTNVWASQGSGNVQQNALFLYGKLPVGAIVLDAMASYGMNATDNSRGDPLGFSGSLQARGVKGNDSLVSLGASMPLVQQETRIAPYIRATWQSVNQGAFGDGSTPGSLNVNTFSSSGMRGVFGVSVRSLNNDPVKEPTTYMVNVGLGMDTPGLLDPALNASLAGIGSRITTPNAAPAFVQASVYATARFADHAFAYAGLTGEARNGQMLVGGNVGVQLRF